MKFLVIVLHGLFHEGLDEGKGSVIFMPHLWALCFLIFASILWFVRLSSFRLKILVKVVFDEVEVQSTLHMFPMI